MSRRGWYGSSGYGGGYGGYGGGWSGGNAPSHLVQKRTKSSFGNTWWGNKWLDSLKNIDYSNRLPRGRSYANGGLVKDMNVNKADGRVSASVQGTRSTPYKQKISFHNFISPSDKDKLIKRIVSTPLLLSKLLSREMPPELFDSAINMGIQLFPKSWGDMDASCSCPDWAVPCKHLAAVIFMLANEIDRDPFLIFSLLKMDLFGSLKSIGMVDSDSKSTQDIIPSVPKLLSMKRTLSSLQEAETPFEPASQTQSHAKRQRIVSDEETESFGTPTTPIIIDDDDDDVFVSEQSPEGKHQQKSQRRDPEPLLPSQKKKKKDRGQDQEEGSSSTPIDPLLKATADGVLLGNILEQIDFSSIDPHATDKIMPLFPTKVLFGTEAGGQNFTKNLSLAYKAMAREAKKLKKATSISSGLIVPVLNSISLCANANFVLTGCNWRSGSGDFEDMDSSPDFPQTHWNSTQLIEGLDQLQSKDMETLHKSVVVVWYSYKLAIELLSNGAFVPQIVSSTPPSSSTSQAQKSFFVRWIPAINVDGCLSQCELLSNLLVDSPTLQIHGTGTLCSFETPFYELVAMVGTFLGYFVERCCKSLNFVEKAGHGSIESVFFHPGIESFSDSSFENRGVPGAVNSYLHRLSLPYKSYEPILLVEDGVKPSTFVGKILGKQKSDGCIGSIWEVLNSPKFSSIRFEMLSDMTILADYVSELKQLLSQNQGDLHFTGERFAEVLEATIPVLKCLGVNIMLPKALRKVIHPTLALSLGDEAVALSSGSYLKIDELLKFQWMVSLGQGEVISAADFQKKVQGLKGVVKMNEKYVLLKEKELTSLKTALGNPNPSLSKKELLQVALLNEYNGLPISLAPSVQRVVDMLLNAPPIAPPTLLQGELRPYQQRGFEWLWKNFQIGWGSILADDMGLGKTIQVICLILYLKQVGQLSSALVVVPTSILINWQKEVSRFAPSLKFAVFHGPQRMKTFSNLPDIVFTTYGMVRGEQAKLKKVKWTLLILDESQNIKNPGTAQTKAVCGLNSNYRIALSGTPVENRLSDYWSIFQFTNAGYLGTLPKFKRSYILPIEKEMNRKCLDNFKFLTSPFILRRLKTDKSIISDLPEKIIQDTYCSLTSDQAALYQNVVDQTMKQIEDSTEGIQRKGLIFKFITSLKQVCNHPINYLKSGSNNPDLSGKTQMLFELLETILERREKTLIFTQYAEMGKYLLEILNQKYPHSAIFFHGQLTTKQREALVVNFHQQPHIRVMILTTKAGGTGLNLVGANNVIHFDLWWNPAVENQATDRAFRIGQKSNVFVYRFISKGTFEEKINEILSKKKELANATVSEGEKWIGDIPLSQLTQMVSLSAD